MKNLFLTLIFTILFGLTFTSCGHGDDPYVEWSKYETVTEQLVVNAPNLIYSIDEIINYQNADITDITDITDLRYRYRSAPLNTISEPIYIDVTYDKYIKSGGIFIKDIKIYSRNWGNLTDDSEQITQQIEYNIYNYLMGQDIYFTNRYAVQPEKHLVDLTQMSILKSTHRVSDFGIITGLYWENPNTYVIDLSKINSDNIYKKSISSNQSLTR